MVRPFVECIEPTRSALHDALQIRTVATRSVATHMRHALAPFSVPGSPAAAHCSLARLAAVAIQARRPLRTARSFVRANRASALAPGLGDPRRGATRVDV